MNMYKGNRMERNSVQYQIQNCALHINISALITNLRLPRGSIVAMTTPSLLLKTSGQKLIVHVHAM